MTEVLRIDWLLRLWDEPAAIAYSFFRPGAVEPLERAAIRGARLGSWTPPLAAGIELDQSEVSVATSHCSPYNAERLGVPPRAPVFLVDVTEIARRDDAMPRRGRGRARDLQERHALAAARGDDRRRRAADRGAHLGDLARLISADDAGHRRPRLLRPPHRARARRARRPGGELQPRLLRGRSRPVSRPSRGSCSTSRACSRRSGSRAWSASSTRRRCRIPISRSSSRSRPSRERRRHAPPVRGRAARPGSAGSCPSRPRPSTATSRGRSLETAPLHPTTPYGVTKVAVELMADVYNRLYGMDVDLAAHLGGLRARQQDADGAARHADRGGRRPTVSGWTAGGDHRFHFIHVEDVARATLCALDCASPEHAVFNVNGGPQVSLREAAEHVRAAVPGADIELGPGHWHLDRQGEMGHEPSRAGARLPARHPPGQRHRSVRRVAARAPVLRPSLGRLVARCQEDCPGDQQRHTGHTCGGDRCLG